MTVSGSSSLSKSASPTGIFVRLVLASSVLLPLAVLYNEALIEAWLPAYRIVFAGVADDFQLLKLVLDYESADRVLRATVTWKHIVVLGEHVISPDPRGIANASTLIAHALQAPLLALIAIFSWPANRLHEFVWRTICLTPMLGLLILADMPCVLAAELWQIAIDGLAPGTLSLLIVWKDFLQGGGRYALGLAAAMAAVHWARR